MLDRSSLGLVSVVAASLSGNRLKSSLTKARYVHETTQALPCLPSDTVDSVARKKTGADEDDEWADFSGAESSGGGAGNNNNNSNSASVGEEEEWAAFSEPIRKSEESADADDFFKSAGGGAAAPLGGQGVCVCVTLRLVSSSHQPFPERAGYVCLRCRGVEAFVLFFPSRRTLGSALCLHSEVCSWEPGRVSLF